MWHKDSITQGELDALRKTAERAWGYDTCHPLRVGSPDPSGGQCFVTSAWLAERLGGYVGVREGHFAWVSPDGAFYIDLTGDHGSNYLYDRNDGFEHFEARDNGRAQKFTKRANRIFTNLDKLLKVGLDYAGDAFPGEEPQRSDDLAYWHDEPNYDDTQQQEYKFVYGNGGLEVSPIHDHSELAEHAGLPLEHKGPVGVGWIVVSNQQATWEVQTNINIKALERIFKDYGKQMGWKWGGITNIEGEPISDEFAPSKTSLLRFAYANNHLLLGRVSHSELLLQVEAAAQGAHAVGSVSIDVARGRASVYPVHVPALPALCEWAEDNELKLYAGNDNLLTTVPDLELDNTGANSTELQTQDPHEDDAVERGAAGLYQCPSCRQLFPRFQQYERHRRDGCTNAEEHSGFPELHADEPPPFQPHFTEQQPETQFIGRREAERVAGYLGGLESDDYYVAYHYGSPVGYARLVYGKLVDVVCAKEGIRPHLLAKVYKYTEKEPKDLLEAGVPFVYDIDEDDITVGKPGQRTSDIPGKFTPGGIVEGLYEPGGKVFIRTMTNTPYTVRHMVELWYYQHPEMTVKSVHLRDDAGGDTKIAAGEDVGGTIQRLVQADPAARASVQALRDAGGNVFAVGGAVRDALLGEQPKDIDLMVTGVPAGQVRAALGRLPGSVKLTGEDFGVFRYRPPGGEEVEIALPRRERSTGPEHKDFDVQADHTMSPEEDLYRRDFTANAMAVDLTNGRLIDPYGGTNDIGAGRLRTINRESLSEDPLRVIRGLVAHGRHNLYPDDATKAQMQAAAPSLQHLPGERIRDELIKLMESKNPAAGIRLAHETGALEHFLPEVAKCMGFDQRNPHHEYELGEHLLNVLDRTAQQTEDPDVRLAGLLHDIGKPDSAWFDPEKGYNHYYQLKRPDGRMVGQNHEDVGADYTRSIMNRLRYSKDRINRVSDLVQHHMWKAFTSEKGARKFLQRVGDSADDLMKLRWADQGGKSEYPTDPNLSLDVQRNLLERVRNEQQPTQRSQLAINGNDLIQAGVPPGPQVGQVLQKLMQAVMEDPRQNQRDVLLNLAREYATLQP